MIKYGEISNQKRWYFPGTYYSRNFDLGSGVSVQIFSIDTNIASVHGMQQVCCQCYGVTNHDPNGICDNANSFDGSTCVNKNEYDACAAVITGWFTDSMTNLQTDLANSNATWRIIQSHYCPLRHWGAEPSYFQLMSTIANSPNQVHAFFCGHTHAMAHDYDSWTGMNHFMNGAGGGIMYESASRLSRPNASTFFSNGNVYGHNSFDFGKGNYDILK